MDREKLIGIITERHSRNVILKGKTSPTTLVREIMERNVVHVRPDQPVQLCMALMTERACASSARARRRQSDWYCLDWRFAQKTISKQKLVIDELEHYIHG